MKIVHISDTHGSRGHSRVAIPKCDVLIHSGDIGGRTDLLELTEFLTWFERQPAEKKIFIPGNHDIILDKKFAEKIRNTGNMYGWSMHVDNHKKAMDLIENFEVKFLNDREYIYEGVKFYGSPYTPSFHKENWAFNADRGQEIKTIWGKIPYDTQVLITHGPVYGILDDLKEYARPEEDIHVGCKDLSNKIKEDLHSLKLHCSGHIHDNYGVQLMNVSNTRKALFSNGAVLNNRYEMLIREPLIITI